MGKASSPARRRGSSTGKASRPDSQGMDGLPWNDADESPIDERDAAFADRYEGLPERLKRRLVKSEVTGRALELRMSDIIPAGGLKVQINGELYDELQAELDKDPNYTSLGFMRVLLKSKKLPMSTRIAVAKEMLPYEHAKNPTPIPTGDQRAVLVIPGAVSIADWERMAAEHRERTKQMEKQDEER